MASPETQHRLLKINKCNSCVVKTLECTYHKGFEFQIKILQFFYFIF